MTNLEINKKLEADALAALALCHSGDTESDHSNADDVLLGLLNSLGYQQVTNSYALVDKWYA